MTLNTKRSLLKLASWSTVAAAAALVGCGRRKRPRPLPRRPLQRHPPNPRP